MVKIKDLSLKKTIFLYLCITLASSFLVSAIIIALAEKVQNSIWFKYINEEKYSEMEMLSQKDGDFMVKIPRPGTYEMTKADNQLSEACDAVETWTPLLLSTIGAFLAVSLFYNNKLKNPIRLLEESSTRIAQNSLDFQVEYELKDEMGRLCTSFEHMRHQLELNNKYLWKTIEEQKNLKSAIAHDIRAPLAVLKGYHEMLLEFVPQDRIDKPKLIEIIEAGTGQVNRLTTFVDTMRQLSSLEDREVQWNEIDIVKFRKQLQETANILAANKEIECSIIVDASVPEIILGDETILLEVCENLLSNALRFAMERIWVLIETCGQRLQIIVSDDGMGFDKDNIDRVTNAYYHNNPQDSLSHFGLGLYICKMLCEKHGGMLLIANNGDGGACVKAVFEIGRSDEINK